MKITKHVREGSKMANTETNKTKESTQSKRKNNTIRSSGNLEKTLHLWNKKTLKKENIQRTRKCSWKLKI